MTYHLAQLNIAKMLAPLDSPVMAGFVGALDHINKLAEGSKGFVWRLKDDVNNAASNRIYDDDFLLVNMSVWESIDDLLAFAYRSDHAEVYKRRGEWFDKMINAHMVLWYVPSDEVPTIKDAELRLNHLRQHGETPFAFNFKRQFQPPALSPFRASER